MTVSSGLRVLIIDDNDICARLLARMFKLEPLKGITTFEITIHNSPEDALLDLMKIRYHIIFTDIEMANMSGCEMAKIIRNTEIYKENLNTPIVAITSKYDDNSRIQYEEAGITECLEKPAKVGSIYAIVKKQVDQ
jgi:CheY-like chemotaxis protein